MRLKPPAGTWRPAAAPSGTVLYLPFLAGSGQLAADAARAASYAMPSGATWAAGPRGPAARLSGTSSAIDTGAERIGGTGLFAASTEQFSVFAAYRTTVSTAGTVVGRGSGSSSTRMFTASIVSGSFQFHLRSSTANSVGGGAAADGNWHSAAVTWDGSAGRCFADGILGVASATVGTNVEPVNQRIMIGARENGNGVLFNGDIDLVIIADRAWSDAEAAAVHDDWASGTFAAVRPRRRLFAAAGAGPAYRPRPRPLQRILRGGGL